MIKKPKSIPLKSLTYNCCAISAGSFFGTCKINSCLQKERHGLDLWKRQKSRAVVYTRSALPETLVVNETQTMSSLGVFVAVLLLYISYK